MADNDPAGASARSTTTKMHSDVHIEKQAGDEGSTLRDSSVYHVDDHQPIGDSPVPKYRNSLLAVIGYLDLTNALDFPANVWNQVPVPLFAKVLMGIGGGIAILSTAFAFWDMVRAWRNNTFLRGERAHLKRKRRSRVITLVEQAWLGINERELGWEVLDSWLLDAFLAVAGILVGTGCVMAIRGNLHPVFLASNILSGYLGNSFYALYAVINTAWCFFMWRRAHACEGAVKRAEREVGAKMMTALKKHAMRHKMYAIGNGATILVSGVGSEISSTKWQGYVVLIPCVLGSIFCNYFWRYHLGYDRDSFQHRYSNDNIDVSRRLQELIEVHEALMHGSAAYVDCYSFTITY
ncbi:hypothetical protein DOTSEDRAFT_39417 [Dothistroma septosporum NZE10]|uniref:Transmembrane protein n=1 Tax=Dothistroma septosporum (strain NZE10 / CBS 128990) TaxID=675120 RepID=N1PBR9_DOTSN|nr:hypothetical protein DOTSEDRAFT_39417 [Dothistroma septosporum NZE10]